MPAEPPFVALDEHAIDDELAGRGRNVQRGALRRACALLDEQLADGVCELVGRAVETFVAGQRPVALPDVHVPSLLLMQPLHDEPPSVAREQRVVAAADLAGRMAPGSREGAA